MVRRSLHFGCVLALRVTRVAQVSVARDVCGPGPDHMQRDIDSGQPSLSARAWAQPKWKPCFVNSVARVPACLAGSRGFDSRTERQTHFNIFASLAQWNQSTGLRSQGSHVQIVQEAPINSPTKGDLP